MSMSEWELDRVVQSLQRLRGQPATGAWQPRRDRVLLGIGEHTLQFVPRGNLARLHTVGARPKNPKNPFSFQGATRAHVRGPLTSLTKEADERIVDLCFGKCRLHLRLTGRRGGLWLIVDGVVVAAYDGPAQDQLPPMPSHAGRGGDRLRFDAPDGDWDLAARRWFTQREIDASRQERRVVIARRLRKRLSRDCRLRAGLDGDLDKASRGPIIRAQADALAANLHTLRRGQRSAVIDDPMDSSVQYSIELDPTRPPAWNMERLYRRARRLDRMGDRVLEHMDTVERRIEVLQQALLVVPDADDATLAKLDRLAPAQKQGRPSEKVSSPWFEWLGPRDQLVLVGRNAKGNRRLTFQRARGHHTWMHLRGKPGAHVIVVVQRGHTADLQTLLAAAQITLLHARVAVGASADVTYTQVRNVRSIKGAADGLVTVHAEKVLHVQRDPSELVGWKRSDQAESMDTDAVRAVLTTS